MDVQNFEIYMSLRAENSPKLSTMVGEMFEYQCSQIAEIVLSIFEMSEKTDEFWGISGGGIFLTFHGKEFSKTLRVFSGENF